jgi:tetratricopeptide (TPR) repeat protein
LRSGCAEGHNTLGNALQEQGRLEEAEQCYRTAIRLKPRLGEAHYNLGNAARAGGRLAEARAGYERTIALEPRHAKAHWNRSLLLLAAGEFEEGWEEFEWRWRKPDTPPRQFPQPLWDGSRLEGRGILLHAEQGLGDTIQFIRYAKLVEQAGGKVCFECPRQLAPLLESVEGIDILVEAGSALLGFDVHAPLASLPRLFGTTAARIPAGVPYLRVGEAFAEKWRRRLEGTGGPRIGLVWAGNPQHPEDRLRSLRLEAFEPLAATQGVSWYSLQFGASASQAAHPPGGMNLVDLGPETEDFRDAAAAIQQLDLVISVDTAMAHLAGALARPVWVLLGYVPDWRWLLDRSDSPWYPSMRLFRQPRPGDWEAVIEAVADALEKDPGIASQRGEQTSDMRGEG